MKLFELPDSPNTRKINFLVFKIMREKPEWFIDDLQIEAVYGCPSSCIWNGGCINFNQEQLLSDEIKKIFDDYNSLGISYRLTFTNRLLESTHLNDIVGNKILEYGHDHINAVIVANDNIEKYVLSNFPKYDIIQSMCRVYETDEEINANSKNTLLCLPIRYNNNFEKLSQLKHHNNLMVLVNEFCPNSNCPFCKEHYETDNKYTLGISPKPMACVYMETGKDIIKTGKTLVHHINQEHYSSYEKLGIIHFKINGRGRTGTRIIPEYAKQLVIEKYRDVFIKKILNGLNT